MYRSQHKQDRYFNENIFKNKRNGVFLDIGAHDGEVFSNTFFFEKELGWTGICVEPNPKVYNRLVTIRDCKCFNNCVSDVSMDLDFTVVNGYAEMLSGITSNYDPRHLQRIRDEVNLMGGSIENIKVRSETITNLSELAGISHFDFCSIDVEGSEINILRSIDFTKIKIDYFVIENNYGTPEVQNFLEQKGYKKFNQIATDECFVHAGLV